MLSNDESLVQKTPNMPLGRCLHAGFVGDLLRGKLRSGMTGCVMKINAVPRSAASLSAAAELSCKVPVIVDTDIGDDIDDTWALAYLLASPRCDVKLVVTAFGDRERHLHRARIIQKMLKAAGKPEVPVALGVDTWGNGKASADERMRPSCAQAPWANPSTTSLDDEIEQDCIEAMRNVISHSPSPITIVALAPMCNIAALAAAEGASGLLANAKLVGMQGSIYRGYGGASQPSVEHNVACDPAACSAALRAPWHSIPVLAPLDICGGILVEGEGFRRLREAAGEADEGQEVGALVKALLDGYSVWADNSETVKKYYPDLDPRSQSTPLFDVAAAFLALYPDGGGMICLKPEWLRVTPTGETSRVASSPTLTRDTNEKPGMTVEETSAASERRRKSFEDGAIEVSCAIEWAAGDVERAFADHVVQVLTLPDADT